MKLWMGFVLIAEEPQQMANVFVAVAILGVLAKRAGRVRVICLVEGSADYERKTVI